MGFWGPFLVYPLAPFLRSRLRLRLGEEDRAPRPRATLIDALEYVFAIHAPSDSFFPSPKISTLVSLIVP
jgi:hypothetical protein